MAAANADPLDDVLAEIKAGKAKPFYLVHGEEFLARRAAEAICDALVPADKRDFNFSTVDAGAGAREVAQHLDTVPMFRGTKAVFVEGADVLLAKRDLAKELTRAKELWNMPARKKDAARRVLAIVAPAGWTWRELDLDGPGAVPKTRWKKEVGLDPTDDKAFFAEIAQYAAEQDLKAPKDEGELLQRAVTNGPPKGNHLVLLCEEYDDKHPVARAVEERGVVLERGVEKKNPKGRGIDAFDIDALAKEVLEPMGKRISTTALRLVKDRIGPAMRQTAAELEKLAIYIGDRGTIEDRDVEALVAPLREEEYYELGNALGDGDTEKALKLLGDELDRGKHGLLLLGGLAASVRRMAVDAAKFAKIPNALGGPKELNYRDFEASIWPQFQALGSGKGSPFPVFMSYKRARKHGLKKLLRALALCAEVDAMLKRGADARLALERLVLAVCGMPR